jgi:long-chain acyl-CoA synthetase
MFNLATLLEETTRRLPDRIAVVFNDTRLTYAQVNGAACQVANALVELGIRPGDRVALSCPNLPYFPIVYYGILKAGAVVVPINVLLKGREVGEHLKDSGAKAYFCFQGSEALPMGGYGREGFDAAPDCHSLIIITADPAAASPFSGIPTLGQLMARQAPTFDTVQRSASDTAVVLYTSGTTGVPKGAELTHSNMALNARLADNQLFNLQDHDRYLGVLPLFHSFGQTVVMNMGFYTGGTVVLMARFDAAEALRLMDQEEISFFAGVPTMYWALLNDPSLDAYDMDRLSSNLTTAVSGGAAMAVELMSAVNDRFQVKILEGYGLSETSPVACFNHYPRPTKPGSVGQPVWGIDLRIVDRNDEDLPVGEQGQILMRGHNIMKGYLGRPEATAEAMKGGWFHTGDIGRLDEDGYLYITDRVKDLVIRGGFNVFPREIEEVLMTHPAISLAAVIGIPDDKMGEEIKAFVILHEGREAEEAELVVWSKERMADYKYPRHFEIVEAMPMTATGKILKRELRTG